MGTSATWIIFNALIGRNEKIRFTVGTAPDKILFITSIFPRYIIANEIPMDANGLEVFFDTKRMISTSVFMITQSRKSVWSKKYPYVTKQSDR